LATGVATSHRGDQCGALEPRGSSGISFKEGDKTQFTRGPSYPLILAQVFRNFLGLQSVPLRCTIIDLDVGVALRDEAPKPQFLVGLNEGKVTTATTLEGTWAFCGGTGKFAGITGQGTYRGRMPSASEVEMSWEGRYELAVSAQAA
jgi:hypothetical protein